MRSRLLAILLLAITVPFLSGQDLSDQTEAVEFRAYPNKLLRINNSQIEETVWDGTGKNAVVSVHLLRIERHKGIEFIILDPGTKQESKWLILYQYEPLYKVGRLFAYKNGALTPEWYVGTEFGNRIQYSASSSLSEGNIQYTPENLGSLELGKPWVEGASGSGIGEYVSLELGNVHPYIVLRSIVISNGFVSFEKPYLYDYNNRVRNIRISSEKPYFVIQLELSDTPNLQEISMPLPTRAVKLELLSVYKGTRYDDTCINFILPITNN